MTPPGVVLAGRCLLWLTVPAVVMGVELPRRDPPLPLGLAAPPIGAITGAALYATLSGGAIGVAGLRRGRAFPIIARSAYLAARSAYEEAIWRGILLSLLLSVSAAGPALAVNTAAFALSHVRSQGRRMLVHLGTGATFGGLFYASGSLAAAILAHATYNILIGLTVEAHRETWPFRPVGMPTATTYHRPASRRRTRLVTQPHTGASSTGADRGAAAELRGVLKRYGKTEALRGVDLVIPHGEIVALLGPNGAGKTTSIAILLGLRRPDSGRALLFGQDPRDPAARAHVGVTPQEVAFPPTLRVREVIDLVRAHYEAPLPTTAVLDRFGLADVASRQTGGLSGGQRRRLGLALAFGGRPSAVFLDEPTTGLDVQARREAWQTIREHSAEGRTVLLTTHYLEEAEALATRVAVIHEGRILTEGTVAEIRAQAGLKRVRVRAATLPELPGVVEMVREGSNYTLYTSEPDPIIRVLVEKGVPLQDLEVGSITLEEAFLRLTGGRL
jgi:ABC-2 type transport system ATP-binding protein